MCCGRYATGAELALWAPCHVVHLVGTRHHPVTTTSSRGQHVHGSSKGFIDGRHKVASALCLLASQTSNSSSHLLSLQRKLWLCEIDSDNRDEV